MVIHKAKFGGKPKTGSKPPSVVANKMLGGAPHRKKAQDIQATMDKGLGNNERGFIQNTPKKATAAVMGRAPPKMSAAKTGTRSDGRKQFKPKGKKVF
jgi:hypothetical protein